MSDKEIINYIPFPIYSIEYNPDLGLEAGKINYFNKKSIDFTGYSEQEIVGMGIGVLQALFHPDDLYKVTNTIKLLLHSKLNNHIEFYRVKSRFSNSYKVVKGYCSIIRPSEKSKSVQFVHTLFNTSTEEIAAYLHGHNSEIRHQN